MQVLTDAQWAKFEAAIEAACKSAPARCAIAVPIYISTTLNSSRILFKVRVQESRKSGYFQIALPFC